MKNMKRLAAATMTAAMAVSMVGVVPAMAEETTTIKVMLWDRGDAPTGGTIENNKMSEYINEQIAPLGIQVEYVSVPRSGSDDVLNTMMAGGQAPDVVFTYDQNIFLNYASNFGLADLTEAYATIGTDIAANIGDVQNMGIYDGSQYAMVAKRGTAGPRHVAYIREDLLDEMGLELPTTKEELIDILYKAQEAYPDMVIWGMGGRQDTEKMYLNFIASYWTAADEKESYIYQEAYATVAPGTIDGIRQLNTLYNDGIIQQDFITDVDESVFKTKVASGSVFFFNDDVSAQWGNIEVLNADLGHDTFTAVNCFTHEDGSINMIFEPQYGMFVMVPATSTDKVDAVMTYLNWLADPENAENVAYTADHTRSEAGVPIPFSADELKAMGYKSTLDDYNILNKHFAYCDTKEGVVESWVSGNKFSDQAWFEQFYDTTRMDGWYRYPTFSETVEADNEYGNTVTNEMLDYVYRLITCAPEDFDSLQEELYAKMVNDGLEEILEQRAEYYDEVTAE